MKTYGYVRVSSKNQNLDRQIIALQEYVPQKNIYMEKISGSSFNSRKEYKKLLKKLKHGDLLVLVSIDRLGRNYTEMLEEWRRITQTIGADIQILDMPLLNTKENVNGLTGKFIADLTLRILSYVSEIERRHIKQRQKEGIDAAIQRGVKFGRPRKEINYDEFAKAVEDWMVLCQDLVQVKMRFSSS